LTRRDQPVLELSGSGSPDLPRSLQLGRRDFLKVLGGGVLVCLTPTLAWTQESGRAFGGNELPKDVSAWIHIAAEGQVRVFTGKVEVGQNIRTSLAQLVAEELRAPFDSITMIMGDTDLTPWDMGTFGSRTTPTMGPQLRTMASAARQMLQEIAAKRWNVDATTLTAADGKVTDPRNSRSLAYGELTRGEKLVKIVSGQESLAPAAEWKIAGVAIPKAEGRDFSAQWFVRMDSMRPSRRSIPVRRKSSPASRSCATVISSGWLLPMPLPHNMPCRQSRQNGMYPSSLQTRDSSSI
jgi:isoquinoline 1-oxidoreductase